MPAIVTSTLSPEQVAAINNLSVGVACSWNNMVIAINCIMTIPVFLCIYGIKTEKSVWMMPYTIIKGIGFGICCIYLGILALLFIFAPNIFSLFFLCVASGVTYVIGYIFRSFYRCAQYFKYKSMAVFVGPTAPVQMIMPNSGLSGMVTAGGLQQYPVQDYQQNNGYPMSMMQMQSVDGGAYPAATQPGYIGNFQNDNKQ